MNQLAPAAGSVSQLLSRFWDYRTAAVAVGYLASYILLDWLSYVQPVLKLGITPWNPQAGLTLAFLLVYGPRWASVTAVAVLLSEILVRQNSVASSLVIGVSMWIALGYGVLAALLRRWRLETPIRTLGAAVRLAVASVAATLVVAGGYVVLFVTAGELQPAHSLESLPRLWIGDLTGILTMTPLLIWASEWRHGIRVLRRHG